VLVLFSAVLPAATLAIAGNMVSLSKRLELAVVVIAQAGKTAYPEHEAPSSVHYAEN
jgi:hypothetical protein